MDSGTLASLGRAALYLGVPFVIMIFVFQWQWAKTCSNNIQVLVAQRGGGGAFKLAPKTGGEVTIKNTEDNTVRTWPINELATIDILYPGVGFVPAFMQKTIRLAILNEGDWEPMLNRSPHRENVASPDILALLQQVAEEHQDDALGKKVTTVIGRISTGPSREMIGNPAILGDMMRSSVMKALATVSQDLLEALKNVSNQLARLKPANPLVVYIGLGLIAIMLGVNLYFSAQGMAAKKDTELIKQALGIVTTIQSNPIQIPSILPKK